MKVAITTLNKMLPTEGANIDNPKILPKSLVPNTSAKQQGCKVKDAPKPTPVKKHPKDKAYHEDELRMSWAAAAMIGGHTMPNLKNPAPARPNVLPTEIVMT